MRKEYPDKHKVIFLTMVRFPHGLAQTNRLISIAGGLVSAGYEVSVFCIKPTENQRNSLNTQSKGTYNLVKFIYTSGTTFRGRNPFRRIYLFLAGVFSATRLLVKENKNGKVQSVFSGVAGSMIIFWFYWVCRILNVNYLQERSEYPFIKERKSWFDKPALFIYLHFICRLFDGFVVITGKLRQYFTPYLRPDCPVYLLPILVEPERFENIPAENTEKYIAYCGSMQGDKDGIPVLIDAFQIVTREFPDLKLYLIGSVQFNGFNALKEKIRLLHLESNIVFTGVADRDHLPEILSNAMMHVLARPDNRQAEAGFPTKLGEYLATGKPVVVTRVGEIPDYFTDKVNAFIAKPNDALDFADKIKEVLQDYEQARVIGLEGQKLSQTVFNYKFQGKQLAAWLEKI